MRAIMRVSAEAALLSERIVAGASRRVICAADARCWSAMFMLSAPRVDAIIRCHASDVVAMMICCLPFVFGA